MLFQLAMMIFGGKGKPNVLFHLARNGVVHFGALRRGYYPNYGKNVDPKPKRTGKGWSCQPQSIPRGTPQGRVLPNRAWTVVLTGFKCLV